MTEWLKADEAAKRLGIKPASLYAYVSRGVLRRHRGEEGHSLFDPVEIERLALRGRPRRRPAPSEVVIESQITALGLDRPYYRGRDALDLAARCAFETVAAWLWTGDPGLLAGTVLLDGAETRGASRKKVPWVVAPGVVEVPFAAPWLATPDALAAGRAAQAGLPDDVLPLDRLQVIAPALAASDPGRLTLDPPAVIAIGQSLIAGMVDCLPLCAASGDGYGGGVNGDDAAEVGVDGAGQAFGAGAGGGAHLEGAAGAGAHVGGEATARAAGAGAHVGGEATPRAAGAGAHLGGATTAYASGAGAQLGGAATGRASGAGAQSGGATGVDAHGGGRAGATYDDAHGDGALGIGIVDRLWARLTPGAVQPDLIDALRMALVLVADHELAASTLAARVAASVRADPYAVVSAGLGVMGGALHGGASLGAEAVLAETGTPDRARQVLGLRLRRGERIPGFGHTVYRDRDSRATYLLDRVSAAGGDRLAVAEAVLAEARRRRLPGPNIEFALATLAYVAGMVNGAGEAIFALGRTVGWLAHALEEYTQPTRLRLRASYVGPPFGT